MYTFLPCNWSQSFFFGFSLWIQCMKRDFAFMFHRFIGHNATRRVSLPPRVHVAWFHWAARHTQHVQHVSTDFKLNPLGVKGYLTLCVVSRVNDGGRFGHRTQSPTTHSVVVILWAIWDALMYHDNHICAPDTTSKVSNITFEIISQPLLHHLSARSSVHNLLATFHWNTHPMTWVPIGWSVQECINAPSQLAFSSVFAMN